MQSDIDSLFHRTDSAEEAVRGARNYGAVAYTTSRVLQVVVLCSLRETSVAISSIIPKTLLILHRSMITGEWPIEEGIHSCVRVR